MIAENKRHKGNPLTIQIDKPENPIKTVKSNDLDPDNEQK